MTENLVPVADSLTGCISGQVDITCENIKTGEVKRVQSGNLVVNNAYIQLAKLLGKVGGSLNPITRLAFGIGGAVAPSVTDTSLTGVVKSIDVVSSYPYVYSVKFTAVWGPTESSSADINEAGLLFSDNSLAARYTFGAMKKSENWTWTIQWTFTYDI